MKKGDAIATIAKPIAKGIDWLLGTNVQGCSGCHQMQNNLNAGMSVIDAVILRLRSSKQQTEGNNTMDSYIITEQSVIEEAESPRDAIAKYAAGQGTPISVNAQIRMQPQQAQPVRAPAPPPPKKT